MIIKFNGVINNMCIKIMEENDIKLIIDLFKSKVGLYEISERLNNKYSVDDIIMLLNDKGISSKKGYYGKFSYDECVKIGEAYCEGGISKVRKMYPDISDSLIQTMCSRLGYNRENYYWSKTDLQYLIDHYKNQTNEELLAHYNYKFTDSAIRTRAHLLGIKRREYWSKEEDEILTNLYSITEIENIIPLLNDRTKNSILKHAQKLKLTSFIRLQERFTEQLLQFIKDNWQKMTDKEMALNLGRKARSVKEARERLRLLRVNKDYSQYKDLFKLFRRQISDWKTNSMKECGYSCIFTGSKDFIIHHLIGFNVIVSEALKIIDKEIPLISMSVNDYSSDEIKRMILIFKVVHSQYPLGVCVKNEIHELFHNIYGRGGNNIEQWNEFCDNYKNGQFDDYLS